MERLSSATRWRGWAVQTCTALAAGSVLAFVRARLLAFTRPPFVREWSELWRWRDPLVEWRVAEDIWSFSATALAGALVVFCVAKVGLRRGPLGRVLALLASLVVAAIVVAGGPWVPPAARLLAPALEHPRLALALGCAIPACALLLLVPASDEVARRGGSRGALPLAALGLLAALAFPFLYRAAFAPAPPSMLVREVAREILFQEQDWRIESARADAPPHAGVLSPCTDYRVDGADLPTLLMPPPCKLAFEVPANEGVVWLRIAAGVSQEVTDRLQKRAQRNFGFAVTTNGERVFETQILAHKELPREARIWRRPPSGILELRGGDVVELSTWIEGEGTDLSLAGPVYEVGFGDVVLERRRESARRPSSASNPSIVLVLEDTLRSDRLSCYDYDKPTAPNLARLAARGLRFERAFSTASWTWPSTASILTGLHPDRHGVTDDTACYLGGGNETIAEALQARGYTTAAFTCNPLITPQKNFDQGFETFDYVAEGFRKTGVLLPSVLRWLDDHAGVRFFLYLHLVDPHHPHEPRAEDMARLGGIEPDDWAGDASLQQTSDKLRQGAGHDEHGQPIPGYLPSDDLAYWNDLYDATVASSDYFLGAVLDRLAYLGIDDETVIAFTSDHGEEWLDHGLLTHGQSVHRELVQIPLVLAGPGIPRGVASPRIVSNRQLAPTLARFGGAKLDLVDDPIDLADVTDATDTTVYFSTMHGWWNGRRERQPIYGMRDGRWVLHYAPFGGDWKLPRKLATPGGQIRLYDTKTDPDEDTDVASQHPDVASEMKTRLLAKLQAELDHRTGAALGAGSATRHMLDGIGYTGPTDEEDEKPPQDVGHDENGGDGGR
jgi:arylsulfatase A-like enzyme